MMTKTLFLLALPLALVSCTTRKAMMAKPLDMGVKAEYVAPFDGTKRAVYDVLGAMAFGVKDEMWDRRDTRCYVINASQGLSAGTTGRYARVVIEKGDPKQTVFVLVESKTATRDAATIDEAVEKELQSNIEKRLQGK